MSEITLINGDCLDKMLCIEDNSIDCIITDPPYLKNYSTGHRKGVKRNTTKIKNDISFDFEKVFSEFKRVTKDDAHIYVFGCWKTNPYFQNMLSKFFKIKNNLIWVKNNWTAGDLFWSYGQSYEEILFATNGRKKLNGSRDRDCLFYSRVAGNRQLHTNQKPSDLIEYLISKSSKEGDTILDPFMGSGTTGVACKSLNRNFIGIELDSSIFNIAKNRLDTIKENYAKL